MSTDRKTIQIGGHSVEVWFNDPPVDDVSYYAELNADIRAPEKDRFFLTYLNDVGCSDLPNKLSFVISYSNSEFKRVNFVKLQKSEEIGCTLTVVLNIEYQQWEMSEAVSSFVFRFIDSIKKELKIDVIPEKFEYGYFVECAFISSNTKDILKWYSSCEHKLERIFQLELVNPISSDKEITRYGESRIHWWIRYVLVPLIGSGTIAAVLAKYVLQ